MRVKFYGETGDEIITAGADSTVRVFATFKADGTFKNLGKAAYNRKSLKRMVKKTRYGEPGEEERETEYHKTIMPPIVEMTCG
jgi:hypothetical protein